MDSKFYFRCCLRVQASNYVLSHMFVTHLQFTVLEPTHSKAQTGKDVEQISWGKCFFAFPCLPMNWMLVCRYACHVTCFFLCIMSLFFFHCKPITKLSGSWSEGHLSTVKLFQPIGSDSLRLKSKNSIVKLNTNRDHHKNNILSVLPHSRLSLLSLVGKQEKKKKQRDTQEKKKPATLSVNFQIW